MNLSNLKPRGLERHKIKWQIKFIPELEVAIKHGIKLDFEDRINQLKMWFQGFVIDYVTLTIKSVIPGWVWLLLALFIALLVVFV